MENMKKKRPNPNPNPHPILYEMGDWTYILIKIGIVSSNPFY